MRSMLTIYPVRRTSIPRKRKRSRPDSFGKMLGKLDAANERLGRARQRR
ncbi:MAG TPA: hypothetical protein VK797_10375 [Tepidisphaeraceae bacterium]|jgi:hypothetical protein|nr:hypothetical protein [Tepidisphaeraceae bacterium]